MFCDQLENSLKNTFLEQNLDEHTEENTYNKILIAATRAFANKIYVQKLIEFTIEENQ